jgi:hypothetical protein
MAGPTLTRSLLRSDVRLHVRDVSSTSPGLSDSNINSLLDRALFRYASIMDGDETLFTSATATLNAGSDSVSVSFTKTPLNVEAVYLSGLKKLTKRTLPLILLTRAEGPDDTGEPSFYAIEAGGSRDSWTVYFDLKAQTSYTVVLWYRKEPTAFSGDSATCPFGDQAGYIISTMAQVDAARILGRPQPFIDNIAAGLPDAIRDAMGIAFRSGTHGGADQRRVP